MRQQNEGLLPMLAGLGMGALTMYVMDPRQGRRRRAIMKDKIIKAWRKSGAALDAAGRDIAHRVQGIAAETKGAMREREVSDRVLAERVRSQLGRAVSHPSALELDARKGRVRIRGDILKHELPQLLSTVKSVRGVKKVEQDLNVYESADDVPSLQGGSPRTGERSELFQSNWAPAARVVVGGLGIGLAAAGAAMRGLTGTALMALGAAAAARAASNKELSKVVGAGAGRGAVSARKTINIKAPVEEVWEYFANYDTFPLFMSNVSDVRNLGNGRAHWVVKGPAGTQLNWDSIITRYDARRELAWKTEPGAAVQNAGVIKFRPSNGSTSVEIKLEYNPPLGAVGATVASILGSDPKRLLDRDMQRMKSLIEGGKTATEGREVTQKDVKEQIH